jgi:peptidoglycan hydrolase CwlO-like protein
LFCIKYDIIFLIKLKNIMSKIFKKISYIFILSIFIFTSFLSSFSFNYQAEIVSAQTDIDRREQQLREELRKIEEEQAVLQKSLDAQKNQTAGFQRDVNILTDQIKNAELEIRKRRLEIEGLSKDINIKNQTVGELEEKLARSRVSLAELIRKHEEITRFSLVEVLLMNDNISDFFSTIDSYTSIQKETENLFNEIRDIIGITETERLILERKQNAELDAQKVIESQKAQVDVKKKEKDSLLQTSKQTEASYQKVLAEKQAQASAIRAALFSLRDAQGIQFGDAVRFAEAASRTTGVRAALILAVLKQESNLGQTLGSCTIYDLASGKSQGVNTGRVFSQGIHPTRDLPVLQDVLKTLGRDPLTTRISCPMIIEQGGGKFLESGYGGAMGPSQFIPSTWVLYIPRLQQIFGTYPNPWNPEQSIMATALLMKDNGAAAGGYTAERNAACRYYSGRICDGGSPPNSFYGNQVLAHAEEFQRQLDFLKEVDAQN